MSIVNEIVTSYSDIPSSSSNAKNSISPANSSSIVSNIDSSSNSSTSIDNPLSVCSFSYNDLLRLVGKVESSIILVDRQLEKQITNSSFLSFNPSSIDRSIQFVNWSGESHQCQCKIFDRIQLVRQKFINQLETQAKQTFKVHSPTAISFFPLLSLQQISDPHRIHPIPIYLRYGTIQQLLDYSITIQTPISAISSNIHHTNQLMSSNLVLASYLPINIIVRNSLSTPPIQYTLPTLNVAALESCPLFEMCQETIRTEMIKKYCQPNDDNNNTTNNCTASRKVLIDEIDWKLKLVKKKNSSFEQWKNKKIAQTDYDNAVIFNSDWNLLTSELYDSDCILVADIINFPPDYFATYDHSHSKEVSFHITTLTNDKFECKLSSNSPLSNLYQDLNTRLNIPVTRLHLMFDGNKLNEFDTSQDLGIQDECNVILVITAPPICQSILHTSYPISFYDQLSLTRVKQLQCHPLPTRRTIYSFQPTPNEKIKWICQSKEYLSLVRESIIQDNIRGNGSNGRRWIEDQKPFQPSILNQIQIEDDEENDGHNEDDQISHKSPFLQPVSGYSIDPSCDGYTLMKIEDKSNLKDKENTQPLSSSQYSNHLSLQVDLTVDSPISSAKSRYPFRGRCGKITPNKGNPIIINDEEDSKTNPSPNRSPNKYEERINTGSGNSRRSIDNISSPRVLNDERINTETKRRRKHLVFD